MNTSDLGLAPEHAEDLGPVATSTAAVFAQVLAPDEFLMPEEAL